MAVVVDSVCETSAKDVQGASKQAWATTGDQPGRRDGVDTSGLLALRACLGMRRSLRPYKSLMKNLEPVSLCRDFDLARDGWMMT